VRGDVVGGEAGGMVGGVAGGVVGGVTGGVSGGVTGGVAGGVTGGMTGRARPGELPKQDGGPLRVGGNIKPPRRITYVTPLYPDDAKAARVAGVVIMEITIAKDGSVSNARILRSVPMLDQAALDAVYQWGFEPTLLNGAPVEVVMTVTVNFTVQ
jgi:periplasmic protein TonB